MSISSLGSMSPAGVYGAGALGARLAVPVGATAANPGNLASLINSEAAGTDFQLAAGTYTLSAQESKIGNGYYGDPNDHTAVVFDGGVTYTGTDPGDTPTGGLFWMLRPKDNNVLANFTIQKYRGNNDNSSASPIRVSGASNCLYRNLLIQDCYRSGFQMGGSNNDYRFITTRYHGSYCWTGSGGSDNNAYNCNSYSSGDENMETRGITPKLDNSNRGISKFNHSTRIQFFDSWFHDILGFSNGLWWDGNNHEGNVYDSLFEDFTRFGVEHELSHGGDVKRNTFNRCGKLKDESFPRHTSAIGIATGGVVNIEDNIINGDNEATWNGISMYQNSRSGQNPDFWTKLCGSVIRNNIISGVRGYFIASHCNFVKDGCNFSDQEISGTPGDPSELTIENNTYIGDNDFWQRGVVTPATWAGYGYT